MIEVEEKLIENVNKTYNRMPEKLKQVASLIVASGASGSNIREVTQNLPDRANLPSFSSETKNILTLIDSFDLLNVEKNVLLRYLKAKAEFELFKNPESSFSKFAFPNVNGVFPKLIANDLVSVQPMTTIRGNILLGLYIWNRSTLV